MRFVYKAGMEPATGTQTTDGEPLELTKLPAEVTMFGIDFLKGQPTKVEPHMFRYPAEYQHAVAKLRGNQHFEEAPEVEDAAFDDVAPDKPTKKGKKVQVMKYHVDGGPSAYEEEVVLDTREK